MATQILCAGVVACLLAATSLASGAEYPVECPTELKTQAIQIVQTPAGWTPFTPSDVRLHGVGIMYGPPAEMRHAKPDFDKKQKNGHVVTWLFDEEDTSPKWINCGYGLGNEVTLSKELDSATASCKVSYTRKQKYAIQQVLIRCASR